MNRQIVTIAKYLLLQLFSFDSTRKVVPKQLEQDRKVPCIGRAKIVFISTTKMHSIL